MVSQQVVLCPLRSREGCTYVLEAGLSHPKDVQVLVCRSLEVGSCEPWLQRERGAAWTAGLALGATQIPALA